MISVLPSNNRGPIPHHESLGKRLQALMLLRILLVSLFLGAALFLQSRTHQTGLELTQKAQYLLIALVYVLTIVYAMAFKYGRNYVRQAYIQLLVDVLIISAIIHATGGIESIFSSLYILSIIAASMLLYRRGSLIIASISSIAYGALMDLHFYRILTPLGGLGHPGPDYSSSSFFYRIAVNIAAFYLVAYLSSLLSEQVRKGHAELKARQVDINQLEALNANIIQNIASGIIVLDQDRRIILFNPAAQQIFGRSETEVFGRPLEQVLPQVAGPAAAHGLKDEMCNETAAPLFDFPIPTTEGGLQHLRCSVSSLELPLHEDQGRIIFIQDVTRLKNFEDRMKRMENLALVGELAAKVAHEIRNPMASISGSVQMLQERQGDDPVNTKLTAIVCRETNRLEQMIKEFLSFARPKKPRLHDFDLDRLILETVALARDSRHWSNRIQVTTELEPLRLHSDHEQLAQVLWNLLLNACEAMPERGELRIQAFAAGKAFHSGPPLVKIIIQDTGQGFNAQDLPRIFEPFFSTKPQGSGLGLAIVKNIITSLGGRVSASNHPAGGARIVLELPVHPPP